MSLLFNMLSSFVKTFLLRSKHLLISWLQSPSAMILEPQKMQSATIPVSPSICHEDMGPDAMILVFWMLSFKPTFPLSSSTFIKRLFSSSSLCAIMVVSSGYLRQLIFLLAVLIPACASSSPVFLTCQGSHSHSIGTASPQLLCMLLRPAMLDFCPGDHPTLIQSNVLFSSLSPALLLFLLP